MYIRTVLTELWLLLYGDWCTTFYICHTSFDICLLCQLKRHGLWHWLLTYDFWSFLYLFTQDRSFISIVAMLIVNLCYIMQCMLPLSYYFYVWNKICDLCDIHLGLLFSTWWSSKSLFETFDFEPRSFSINLCRS